MASSPALATGPAVWFARPRSRPEAEHLLVALPFSGAGTAAFTALQRWLPDHVELAAVRLPGREQRIGETHRLDPAEIAAAVAARVDRPYALYGHSLGARLGFEVVRALRSSGAPSPLVFYAAAARPPDVVDPLAANSYLPDDELLAVLEDRLETPVDIFDEPELRDLLLPVLRADLQWIHRYTYLRQPPLDVPIVAIAGTADREITAATMRGWERQTSASFAVRRIAGGHFFVDTSAERLAPMLAADLRGMSLAAAGEQR